MALSFETAYLQALSAQVLDCLECSIRFDTETEQERVLLPDERKQLAERIARRILTSLGRQFTDTGSVT
jgi:hypothetical protein